MNNWGFHIFKWHSINLLPHWSIVSICDDDTFKIIGRAIQITIFGFVIDFMFPASKSKRAKFSPVFGPMWSRRRKLWYRKLDKELGL